MSDKTKELKRRGISGVYIFDTFPGEEKRQPTCFEDCQKETQDKWLDSLEPEAVKRLAQLLGNKLTEICDTFGITTKEEEDE